MLASADLSTSAKIYVGLCFEVLNQGREGENEGGREKQIGRGEEGRFMSCAAFRQVVACIFEDLNRGARVSVHQLVEFITNRKKSAYLSCSSVPYPSFLCPLPRIQCLLWRLGRRDRGHMFRGGRFVRGNSGHCLLISGRWVNGIDGGMLSREKRRGSKGVKVGAYQIIRLACSFGWSEAASWHLGDVRTATGKRARSKTGMGRDLDGGCRRRKKTE